MRRVRTVGEGAGQNQAGRPLDQISLFAAGVLVGLAAPFIDRVLPRRTATTEVALSRGGRAPSLKALALKTWKEFQEDDIPSVAGAATYFVLLGLFPAIGIFVSLYGLVANLDDAQRQVANLGGVLPQGAIEVIGEQMSRLAATDHGTLGLAFAVSLAISLWSSNAGARALIKGLNIAYETREGRSFLLLNAVSLAFTLGGLLLAVAGIAAVAAVPEGLTRLGLGHLAAISSLRWPALLVVTYLAITMLYRYGPGRTVRRSRWLNWGALSAAICWVGMSIAFSAWVEQFGHYNKTYGSLGAIVGFMTWIWLSLIVVLLGAELNSELETSATANAGNETDLAARI